MSARITSTCVLLTVWLAASTLVVAQDQSQDQFLKKADFEKWQKTTFEELKNQVSGLETQITPLVPVVQQLDVEVGRLGGEVQVLTKGQNALAETQDDQARKLGTVAKEVLQGTDSTWVPDIRSAWENEEFRNDMRQAVHDSMDRQGTVWIHNKTTVGHTVLVNNSQYVYVGPGQDRFVQGLSVGTISTELVGYERPRNWTLGPPNYEQHVDIVPNSPTRVVVARPVNGSPTVTTVYSPPVYSPPLIVDPPVFVAPPIVVGPPVIVDPPVVWVW
jgi:hypothetical protein